MENITLSSAAVHGAGPEGVIIEEEYVSLPPEWRIGVKRSSLCSSVPHCLELAIGRNLLDLANFGARFRSKCLVDPWNTYSQRDFKYRAS